MNNYTNIYDIDGNIIRKAGDNHKFTIEELEKMVDDLTEKVRNNPDNKVYKVYLNNVNTSLFKAYNSMSPEQLKKRLSILSEQLEEAKKNQTEEKQKELEDVNESIDKLKETVMDEYVEPIEEVK